MIRQQPTRRAGSPSRGRTGTGLALALVLGTVGLASQHTSTGSHVRTDSPSPPAAGTVSGFVQACEQGVTHALQPHGPVRFPGYSIAGDGSALVGAMNGHRQWEGDVSAQGRAGTAVRAHFTCMTELGSGTVRTALERE